MRYPLHSARSFGALAFGIAFLHANPSHAGKITYVPVSGDADSGISSAYTFTSAVNAAGECEIGGIKLFPLSVAGNVASANDVSVTATSGSLVLAPGPERAAQGVLGRIFAQSLVNEAEADGAEEEIVIDPASLDPNRTYHLRIYVAGSGGTRREVNLSFAGDGRAAVQTGFFDEEDAATSAGRFSDSAQPYYIDYRFIWDGRTTPGVIVSQRDASSGFAIYAITNVEEDRPVTRAANLRAPARLAPAEEAVDVGVQSETFYSDESLNAHGQWIQAGGDGAVWHPTDVGDDWRPYTRGSWVHSDDCGWTFDSSEEFGWATCHYGRWAEVADVGWCWTPGRQWGPAWVSWRSGDDCVGWAPLPPEVRCDVGYGVGPWVDARYDRGPGVYNFCRVADLGLQLLGSALFPVERNAQYFQSTTNITNIVRNKTTIYNAGPKFTTVNNIISTNGGRPVPTAVVQLHNTAVATANATQVHQNGVLALRAPAISPANHPIAPAQIAKVIAAPVVNKGWAGVTDPKMKAALQQKIAAEPGAKTGGPAVPGAAQGVLAGSANPRTGVAQPAQSSVGQVGTHPGAAGTPLAGSPAITGTHPLPGTPIVPGSKDTASTVAPAVAGTIGTVGADRAHPGRQGGVAGTAVTAAGPAAGKSGPTNVAPITNPAPGARLANTAQPGAGASLRPGQIIAPPTNAEIARTAQHLRQGAAGGPTNTPEVGRPDYIASSLPNGRQKHAGLPAGTLHPGDRIIPPAGPVTSATQGADWVHVRQGAKAHALSDGIAAHALPGTVAGPSASAKFHRPGTPIAQDTGAVHSDTTSPRASAPISELRHTHSPPTLQVSPSTISDSASHTARAHSQPQQPSAHASAPQSAYHEPAPRPQSAYHEPAPRPQSAYHEPAPRPQPAYHEPASRPQPAYHEPVSRPQPAFHAPAPHQQSAAQSQPSHQSGSDKKKKE